MRRRTWFDRSFEPGLPIEAFPEALERIRGTPLRVAERVSRTPAALVARRIADRWSIQEHVGHLVDLESLWAARLDDFDNGAATLQPADVQNRATWEADHNSRAIKDLLGEFQALRDKMVARVEAMGSEDLLRSAFHPRLVQPMTVVDLTFFVAEHDDHHLASITELMRQSDG